MLLPVKRDVLMFESDCDFWDNSYALYEYVKHRYDNKYKLVWSVRNTKPFKDNTDAVFVNRFKLAPHIR